MQSSFISTPVRRLVVGSTLAAAAVLAFASTACSVTVANTCNGGLTDCGGYCVDLSSDPNDCGGCGLPCASTDICVNGQCVAGVCAIAGSGCQFDGDCCTNYCINGVCACLSSGSPGCNANDDCCSGSCDQTTGYCN